MQLGMLSAELNRGVVISESPKALEFRFSQLHVLGWIFSDFYGLGWIFLDWNL